jgi:hypothetical protein
VKTKIVSIAFAILFLSACSNDPDGNVTDLNYQPLTTGSYWKYNVSGQGTTNQDQLNVGSDITLHGKVYKKMNTSNLPNGFYSSSLNNNGLRKDNGSLFLSGDLGLDFGGTLPIAIDVEELKIFNQSANPNTELGIISGTMTQTLQGYPLTIDYNLKTVALENLASYTSNNVTYTDVKKTKVVLNLRISTTIVVSGFTVQVAILNTQDVLVSTQYYAKNIGVVYTKTDVSYQLQNFSQFGIVLPIPQSGSSMQEEFLDSYLIN